MEENYDEMIMDNVNHIVWKKECYFCHKLDPANYFIDIGKYYVCGYCWKRFSVFVKEWFEHDILK